MEKTLTARNCLDTQVAIVGGGPVGIGLAIELGQRGVHCVLVERFLTPQPIPKGQNLTQRTMEHFHFWRAERELRAARTIPASFGIGGLTSYGSLLGPYHYDWLQRDLVQQYYYTTNERLPQYATEKVLRERLAQLPCVQTFYGWEMQNLCQDDRGVTATVSGRNGEGEFDIRSTYAVGCDGSRSVVRQQVGITQSCVEHDRLMVLLVFRSTELHELLQRFPGKSYYNVLQPELKGYWKFFGRVDLGNTWFFHAPVPPGTTKANFDFAAYLHDAVGANFKLDIEYIGFWDLRFALADQYRSGRVFVAGDAAHSHPPYGGYGVNSGLEDARNLGWKIAAVLQGWCDAELLNTYDAERRPVFESTMQDFIAKSIEEDGKFLGSYDPVHDRPAFELAWNQRGRGAVGEVDSFEPNYEGSSTVIHNVPRDRKSSAKGRHSLAVRAGHHLSPAQLPSGRNVFEKLGDGFSLLAFGADPSTVLAFQEEACALAIPLTLVEDSFEGAVVHYESRLTLVRPDHFVAWSTPLATVSRDVVRRILAQSTAMPIKEKNHA